jgi:hypothetical protein
VTRFSIVHINHNTSTTHNQKKPTKDPPSLARYIKGQTSKSTTLVHPNMTIRRDETPVVASPQTQGICAVFRKPRLKFVTRPRRASVGQGSTSAVQSASSTSSARKRHVYGTIAEHRVESNHTDRAVLRGRFCTYSPLLMKQGLWMGERGKFGEQILIASPKRVRVCVSDARRN